MGMLIFVLLQGSFVYAAVRQQQRAGIWVWWRFVFAIAFLLLDSLFISGPLIWMDRTNRWFWPVCYLSWAVAALNFVWFIFIARRWGLPQRIAPPSGPRQPAE